jgi:hypothetical protein
MPLQYTPPNLIPLISLIDTDMKMDVRNMSDFESGSFEAVIDKGTISIAVVDSIVDAIVNIFTHNMALGFNCTCYLQEP